MSAVRAAGILLGKELRLEFRSRELLSATIIFALVVVVLFSFAFDPTASESRRFGPGLLWIAFLFAGSLMLNPSFAREQANDTLDALRLAPISSFAILFGKMLANFIFMSLAELILVPVFAVLYNISLAGIVWRLVLVLILGTAGLTRPVKISDREIIPGSEFSSVLAYMRDHFHLAISNRQLARQSHMSVRAFERKFQNSFHVTPQKYLRKLQLLVASRALVYTAQSLTDVAANCG